MTLIAVILGAVGAILSVFKNRWCFAVWLPCNGFWIWYNYPGIQSWVFLVMFWSCLVGWWTWSHDQAAGDAMHKSMIAELYSDNKKLCTGLTHYKDKVVELENELDRLKESK